MSVSSLSAYYRTAFITGASTGLGRAFAGMLLAEGVKVWGTARSAARLSALAGREGFSAVVLDLKDGDGAVAAFRQAEGAAGGFDLVINNAGQGAFGDFLATDFSIWREQLGVMLLNTAQLAQAALAGMRERKRGALVNLSSLAAEFPLPFQSAYNMAKAGLSALSESLMVECAGTGVVILDVRPGDYRTDFESALQRPAQTITPRMARAWAAFERMMRSGPPPEHAARALRGALLRRRSGTVRCGRVFQSLVAPFLARFGSLALKRRVQARYFDL